MRALATALLGVAVATAPALAQRAPKYDKDAEVTVTGVVVDLHVSEKKNDHPGLHFILKITSTSGEAPAAAEGEPSEAAAAPEPAAPAAPESPALPPGTVEIHACPMDLLGYLDFKVEKGDEMTVTGSRPGNGPILVARELVKGVVKLQVRDPEGVPIWTDLE
jgi:hypothetical protein